MKKKKVAEYWIADDDTYSKLQKLKEFVDFVAGLEYTTDEQKTHVAEIKTLIETINKPETIKDWYIGIDIFDSEVQTRKREGIYWRKWMVCFEEDRLVIEAQSKHSEYFDYSTDFYNYNGSVNFLKDCSPQRIYLENDPNEFIADAKNYKSYITETLNEIEIDINIW